MSPSYARKLADVVDVAAEALLGMSDESASMPPAPGKWSPKEIIGHLIDSAANNHQRFIRARWMDDLVFPGYDQEAWVSVQEYRHAPWEELIGLWHAYNLHLARVMRSTPEAVRALPHSRHNLHEIAWRTVPIDQPATLDYLMEDYVEHLKHHLSQISEIARRQQ